MKKQSKARTHTGVRIEPDVLREIEAYAERVTQDTGVPINRAMAIRLLIQKGLAAEAAKRKK
jgi:hypothetical protein